MSYNDILRTLFETYNKMKLLFNIPTSFIVVLTLVDFTRTGVYGVTLSTITLDSISGPSSTVTLVVDGDGVVATVVVAMEVALVWNAERTHESPTCLKGDLHWHRPNRFGIRKSQWLSAVHSLQWALL